MQSDTALLQRARRFDEDALAEIYDALSPAIYAYALRISGDVDAAEECVSETFSRFLIALRHGKGPNEHIKAYLYRIAHNWLTDRFRRTRPEGPLDPELRASPHLEPPAAAQQAYEARELRRALALLTPDQRQVIALKYLEGLENAEIAELIQKPVGAVKSLQHRALAGLRRILEPGSPAEEGPGAASPAAGDD